jgi:peptidase E
MTNEYMKKCSTSLAMKGMQIKSTLSFHLISVRMAIFKDKNNNKFWLGCGETETLTHCWWEYKLVQPLWEAVWRFLKKLKMEVLYDPVIPLLGTPQGT